LHVRHVLLEVATDAADRAARTGARYERADLAVHLRKDLGTGRREALAAVMRVEVRRVVELVREEPAILLGEPRGDVAEVIRALDAAGLGDIDLGAELTQCDALVGGDLLRD